ncbi:MAG: hypothetical protein HQL82_15225 [Magnetococcales bacterium]|nr:hypothetical protein [Magnetococcales bacterium]
MAGDPGGREDVAAPFLMGFGALMAALALLLLLGMAALTIGLPRERPHPDQARRDREVGDLSATLDQRLREAGLPFVWDVPGATLTLTVGAQSTAFPDRHIQPVPAVAQSFAALGGVLLGLLESRAGRLWVKRIHVHGFAPEGDSYFQRLHLGLGRAEAVVCALLSAQTQPDQRRRLQRLLLVQGSDGGLRSGEETAITMTLDFRQAGDTEVVRPPPDLPLGPCPGGGAG